MHAPAPPTTPTTRLHISSDADLAQVRHQVRRATARIGFSLVQQTKLVTAASELARNTLVHGGGGHVDMAHLDSGTGRGLRLAFTDEGPGITDIELAMTDGYTSGGGLGLGLSGARRLVQEFTLDSHTGHGTTVTITEWLARLPAARTGGP
ncbi:ATP-binding protein [Streptomyces sp. NPDC048392]|uniref:ATP-binding protein n=1 Tax=Streptomyces sp. NPDC048392 TaxID=3365543 RepID=UPI003714B10C